MYDIETGEILVSRDVIFYEEMFPYIIQKEVDKDTCKQIFLDSGIVDDGDAEIPASPPEQYHSDADGAAQMVEQLEQATELASSDGPRMFGPSESPR